MEEQTIDLFEHIETLPQPVQDVLNKWEQYEIVNGLSYKELDQFLKELKPLGYSFEYGLDAIPYELKKIS